jgi:predicted nucleotidyltransferase
MEKRYDSYIAGYRRRLDDRREARERDRQHIIGRLRGLSDYFDGLPGLRRVYLFGSATQADRFSPASDIDLAFEGLAPEAFCSALSELVDRLERSVDAVRLEDARPLLRDRILRGEVVYERGSRTDT